jgi:hypothetical protein
MPAAITEISLRTLKNPYYPKINRTGISQKERKLKWSLEAEMYLIIVIRPDVIFARSSAMRTFFGSLVSGLSYLAVVVKLLQLGPFGSSGWSVFTVVIALVVILPIH